MSPLRRYTVAALLTLAALGVALIGEGAWGPATTYSFFLGAVMLSSWISGLGPGILSTVLGMIAADYFLLSPVHAISFDAAKLVQLSAFVGISVLISSLNDARRRAVDTLAAERAQLEDRVAARTAEVASLARAEEARLRAQEANQAKDEFLATLSHELRSPLNVMLGWTRLLRSGQLGAEATARGFDVLDRSVHVQAKLIDDLLDVSRIIAGKLRVETRRVDLAKVAALAVDAARPDARARGVTLDAEIAPSLMLHADPHRLQQIISNVLNNALKFTPEHGSVHVRVERAGDRARIAVRDSGIGIRRELLPRIFDRFQQGDSSTTRTHGGLGLGLAIVKHLVEQHGGQISAASDGPGCGSTFTVTLPLIAEHQHAADAGAEAGMNESLLEGLRILVVDDDADARVTIGAMLEQFGAEPTVVSSARDAVAEISRERPDILLSDVAMPEEDGLALIREIRATVPPRRLPAAALSAYTDSDSKANALDAGFQAYLSKPVEPVVLAETLAALVQRIGP